jgi:hypothetical protein
MLLNIVIAAILFIATTAIHAVGMMLSLNISQRYRSEMNKHSRLTRILRVSGIVLLMFFVSVVEVLIWAITYLALNAIKGLEQALYFSMVTFTTLGYGDVVLTEQWRLLSSFEAANGIIMFGWTIAIVGNGVQRIYFGEKHAG